MGVGWNAKEIPAIEDALESKYSGLSSFEIDYETGDLGKISTITVHAGWNVRYQNADKKYDWVECDVEVDLTAGVSRVAGMRLSSENREKKKEEYKEYPAMEKIDSEHIIQAVNDGIAHIKNVLENRFMGWR